VGGDEFLVTAETAFGAATAYDWLYDGLTEPSASSVAAIVISGDAARASIQLARFRRRQQRCGHGGNH